MSNIIETISGIADYAKSKNIAHLYTEGSKIDNNIIQINGKKRGEISVCQDADQDKIMTLIDACEPLQKHLEGKTLVKTIVVTNKLVNMVVK